MSSKSRYPRSGLIGWLCVLKWEGMREQDRANERRVNLFAILWAASLIVVAAMAKTLNLPVGFGWMLAAVPALFGLLCLKAYLKMLREADEMLRQLYFEAMAVGFGTGLIIGMTAVVLDLPAAWTAPAIVAPMCFAFVIRVILAAREVVRNEAGEAE